MPAAAQNGAVSLLARMLAGIDVVNADPEQPDVAFNLESTTEHGIAGQLILPGGDTYRVSVEWLSAVSP